MSRRKKRYGKVTRGWDWKTLPELLEAADSHRESLGISKTQYIEEAIKNMMNQPKITIPTSAADLPDIAEFIRAGEAGEIWQAISIGAVTGDGEIAVDIQVDEDALRQAVLELIEWWHLPTCEHCEMVECKCICSD